MHLNNQHRDGYDMAKLSESHPALEPYLSEGKSGRITIDFTDPNAVKALNAALLIHHYDLSYWDIPEGYLCPAVPSRADYIHTISDLVGTHQQVKCLDMGSGANCVYPIIGAWTFGWRFVGSETDPVGVANARKIVDNNPGLEEYVEIREQTNPQLFFKGIIKIREKFDVTICNPPFHTSAEAALQGAVRKVKGVSKKKENKPTLNFSGQSNELWTEGGEKRFVKRMIKESRHFRNNCKWFSTLVSKEEHLKGYIKRLKEVEATQHEVLPMHQGNKISRILAWRF